MYNNDKISKYIVNFTLTKTMQNVTFSMKRACKKIHFVRKEPNIVFKWFKGTTNCTEQAKE